MKLLLDTHCWLWLVAEPERIRREALDAVLTEDNEVHFSAASAWEIVIKHGLGKLALPLPPEQYVPSRVQALGHRSLPITQQHTLKVADLPLHHKDPFDRILVAQAQVESMHLVTADRQVTSYQVPVIWAAP